MLSGCSGDGRKYTFGTARSYTFRHGENPVTARKNKTNTEKGTELEPRGRGKCGKGREAETE